LEVQEALARLEKCDMPRYSYDHIHLRTKDPMATAQYYHKMFDAKIVESVQSDGQKRIDLDLNGLTIFIARVAEEEATAPDEPRLGLDHFGLLVDNLEESVAELKRLGADFAVEPRTIRPGVKIAFVRAPDGVRIELLERS
jgi:lactoylglutathione lyase